jgi:serine/threonine protein kinase
MEFGQASPASDLFSLGVTCFHLLTNHHPSGLMRHEGYRWLEHWQRHLPQLDPRLEQVLGQLLVKDPARRCPSSEVLLKQLPALEAERWELHPWSSKFVTEPLPACKLDEIGDRAVDQSPLPLVSPIVYPKKAGLLKPIPLSMVCQWLLEVSLGALAGAIAGINLALILIAPAIYILSRVAFGERSLEEAYFLGTRSGLLTGTVLGMFAGAVPSARVRVKQEITKRFKGRRKFPTATRSRRRR